VKGGGLFTQKKNPQVSDSKLSYVQWSA